MRDERTRIRAWEIAGVAMVFGVAATLRLSRLDLGWFGVDQARDIATALDIAAGRDFPTIGPTMRRVTRLGALYYYFWAAPYLVWSDPIAGYWFAALLGLATLFGMWWIARGLWGPRAALIALMAGAVHPVWVIDSRICWAPAALPAIGVLLLRLMLGADGRVLARLSAGRAAALGALLGLAVQLHLTMVGWVAAAAVLAAIERPARRALAAGTLGFIVTALPALWAVAAPAVGDAGIGALAGRGMPAPTARLMALFALPLRVPTAFAQWADHDPRGGSLACVAALLLSALTWAGAARLAVHAVGGERAARVLVAVLVVVSAMVVTTPGESWYYYIESLLPVWALCAGALVAPAAAPLVEDGAGRALTEARARDGGAPWWMARAAAVVGGLAVAAALVLAVRMTTWLRFVAQAGYVPVEPSLLSLDGRPGRDAAVPGRLVTMGVKRGVAAALGAWAGVSPVAAPDERPGPPEAGFGGLWRRLHGPALADVTGDNGFWLRWQTEGARARHGWDPARHVAIWYRDDPIAVALASAPAAADEAADEIERTAVGPLLVVRYRSAIDYASCRGDGRPLTVPIRVVPHPKRYGDGTVAMPRALPAVLECALAPGRGATRVVAALGGPGAVTVIGADGARTARGRESALCVPRAAAPTPIRIEIAAEPGASDLDLYDIPIGVGCP